MKRGERSVSGDPPTNECVRPGGDHRDPIDGAPMATDETPDNSNGPDDRETSRRRVDSWIDGEAASDSEALAEVSRAFRTLLENIPGMAYRCANERKYTMEFISGKAAELTGYRPDELEDNRVVAYGDLIHPDDREGVWAKVQHGVEQGEAFQLMYRIHTRDEELRWVYEQGCGVYDEEGDVEALEGFISDVTEQRQIEERFFRAERMTTVARLVEQLGDDFEDQLSLILSYAEIVRGELGDEEKASADLDLLVDAAERASIMTRQILKSARPGPGKPRNLDLNIFLDNHREVVESIVGDAAELDFDFEPGIGRVEIDPTHLSELLAHLVLNAREAIDEPPGRIAVRSDRMSVGDCMAFEHAELEVGEYLTLAVEDDGHGMDEETRRRVFEPYFSTKDEAERSEHRGMGLPIVYGLIRRVNGYIDVESEPGEGTTMTVYLPRVG